MYNISINLVERIPAHERKDSKQNSTGAMKQGMQMVGDGCLKVRFKMTTPVLYF